MTTERDQVGPFCANDIADQLLAAVSPATDSIERNRLFAQACHAVAWSCGLPVLTDALRLILSTRAIVANNLTTSDVLLPPYASEFDILFRAATHVVATNELVPTFADYYGEYAIALRDHQAEAHRRLRSQLHMIARLKETLGETDPDRNG
jgi:hypothetical protein